MRLYLTIKIYILGMGRDFICTKMLENLDASEIHVAEIFQIIISMVVICVPH